MRRHFSSSNLTRMGEERKKDCPYAVAFKNAGDDGGSRGVGGEGGNHQQQQQHHCSWPAGVEKCPAFQSGSCPFRDVKSPRQVRETLLRIPPSHFGSGFGGGGGAGSSVSEEETGNGSTVDVDRDDAKQANGHGGGDSSSSSEFVKVLLEIHQVHQEMSPELDEAFRLPGGCPVQTLLQGSGRQQIQPQQREDVGQSDSSGRDEGSDARRDKKAAQTFTEALEEYSLAAIMARMANEMETQPEQAQLQKSASIGADSTGRERNWRLSGGKDHNDDAEPSSVDAGGDATASAAEAMTTTATLSKSLKSGTVVSHQAAESVHFVRNFIRGKIDRVLYGDLVSMLFHVYDALEEALGRHAPEHFPTCHFPRELSRKESLTEDVDYWHRGELPPPTPAVRDYVDRIHHLCRSNPLLLLSHSYTRYLGDLSGGKVLARVARRALNLADGGRGGFEGGAQSGGAGGRRRRTDGLAFYEFENIDSAKLFKDVYRRKLDELVLSPGQVTALVNEANVAFLLNMRLFEELDVKANIPGASVRSLSEALSYGVESAAPANGKGYSIGFTREDGDGIGDSKEQSHPREGQPTEADSDRGKKCPFLANKEERRERDPSEQQQQQHLSQANVCPFMKRDQQRQGTTATAPDKAGCPFMTKSNEKQDGASNQCPLLAGKSEGKVVAASVQTKSRCPWPFILLHDPRQGLLDWQTWLVLVILAWCYFVAFGPATENGGNLE